MAMSLRAPILTSRGLRGAVSDASGITSAHDKIAAPDAVAQASAEQAAWAASYDGGRCGLDVSAGKNPAGNIAASDALATPPVGGDNIEDDQTSTTSLDVNPGSSIHSALDHPGDHDWIQVDLAAGETYEFTATPDDTDGNTGPDLQLYVYDKNGNFITVKDSESSGGSETFDFKDFDGGHYFIDVAGYNDAAVGGYTLFGAVDTTDPDPYAGTPLDATDWGVRVDTDGKTNAEGDDIIQVYFAKQGEVWQNSIPPVVVAEGWSDWEKADAFTSFQQYENIIDVDFREVDDAGKADFIFLTSSGPAVLLGAMNPPGEDYEGQAWFNNKGIGWDEGGLAQGGYGFITFTHELGHGMGMSHPHDNGGESMVMHGVESDTDSGQFGMNQGVWTVMTYNDGWPDGPDGSSPDNDYGWSGTLMAFDVAVLQDKYGANTDYKTGDDTYLLPDENAAGTFYSCLWDAGGRDRIAAGDAMDATIDLRAATLRYEPGGGGWVSHGAHIYGGYTIANGVVIEDAEGGRGDDLINGNNAQNVLEGLNGGDRIYGRGGADDISGGAGRDALFGGAGDDDLTGGGGRDALYGGAGGDHFLFLAVGAGGKEIDRILDLDAGDTVDLSAIDADATTNANDAFILVNTFTNTAGQGLLSYDEARDRTLLLLDDDGDGRADLKLVMDGDQSGFGGFVL